MTIETPKPKPLPFIARAEGFLAKKLGAWWADLDGSPAAPFALNYARREGWVLENESLDAVSPLNLFPSASITDLKELKRQIDAGTMTEAQATKEVARRVTADLGEVEAAINRLRLQDFSVAATQGPAAQEAQGPRPTALPQSDPTPPVKTPETASQSVRGTPEAVTSFTVRLHRATIGGLECYTLDKAILATLEAGQTQHRTLEAQVQQGDFGLCIQSLRVVDPIKP